MAELTQFTLCAHLYFGSMQLKRLEIQDSNSAPWLSAQADITMIGSQPNPQFQVDEI
jgi:hypothetical protein